MPDWSQVQAFAECVIENVERVIVGKRSTVELAVIGLLSQGHLLIEYVTGVGKTMLARSLARSGVRSAASNSPPTCCPATSPASPSSINPRASSSSGRGR
jgi:hypothetical protein